MGCMAQVTPGSIPERSPKGHHTHRSLSPSQVTSCFGQGSQGSGMGTQLSSPSNLHEIEENHLKTSKSPFKEPEPEFPPSPVI